MLLGLGIAGYTYGALLGAFLLGLAVPRANGRDAIAAFLATVVAMTVVVRSYALAFTWYVPLGVLVFTRRRRAAVADSIRRRSRPSRGAR